MDDSYICCIKYTLVVLQKVSIQPFKLFAELQNGQKCYRTVLLSKRNFGKGVAAIPLGAVLFGPCQSTELLFCWTQWPRTCPAPLISKARRKVQVREYPQSLQVLELWKWQWHYQGWQGQRELFSAPPPPSQVAGGSLGIVAFQQQPADHWQPGPFPGKGEESLSFIRIPWEGRWGRHKEHPLSPYHSAQPPKSGLNLHLLLLHNISHCCFSILANKY